MVCLKASTMGVRPTRWRGPPPKSPPWGMSLGGVRAPHGCRRPRRPPSGSGVAFGCLSCTPGGGTARSLRAATGPRPRVSGVVFGAFFGGEGDPPVARRHLPPARPPAADYSVLGCRGEVWCSSLLRPPSRLVGDTCIASAFLVVPWGPEEVWYSSLLRSPSRFGWDTCICCGGVWGEEVLDQRTSPPPPAACPRRVLGAREGMVILPSPAPVPGWLGHLLEWWRVLSSGVG